jgi:hypothetical protein
MTLWVEFDTTYLTLVAAEHHASSPVTPSGVFNLNQNPMAIGFAQPPAFPIVNANATGIGTLATLIFEVAANAPEGLVVPITVSGTVNGGNAGVTDSVARNVNFTFGSITVVIPPDISWGDVDFSGTVDFEDIFWIQLYIADLLDSESLAKLDMRAADVDLSSIVDFEDIFWIQLYIADLIDSLPVAD